jgi:PAS domain S-box-containing protein
MLVEGISDYAIYMLDPTGVVTTWNPGAERFKGYTADEILGEHFSRFYTEEDRKTGLPARALRTAEREGRFEHEGWRVRKDGSLMWAHVVIDSIRDRSGTLVGFAKVTRDITQRKENQEALRLSEERFRLLVQGVTDYAIYMLDPEGRIANWNTGAQRFKGYTEDEVIGEHFSRFYTEEDRARGLPQRGLETAIREGRFENEGWRVRKDGSRFWAHVVIDPIRNELGRLVGFAKVTRDITDKHKAQEELEATRAALFQSQKMEAVGTLVGGIAHDFNNLLAVLIGNLELLRKRVPEEQGLTRLLDNSMQAAQRGASLTQRMLAFARRQDLDVEPVDLRDLVQSMSDLLQRSIGSAVQIETRFPMRLDRVLVDTNQLELALLNLVVNARDAMPDGGMITISARAAPAGAGDFVCLCVTDTGQGMDEETLARAVEPFFTTKGVGKGTGLGLSMVHGLAEQSGGRLVLTSQKGQGTTAELWLPIADTAAGVADRAPAEEAARPAQRRRRQPRAHEHGGDARGSRARGDRSPLRGAGAPHPAPDESGRSRDHGRDHARDAGHAADRGDQVRVAGAEVHPGDGLCRSARRRRGRSKARQAVLPAGPCARDRLHRAVRERRPHRSLPAEAELTISERLAPSGTRSRAAVASSAAAKKFRQTSKYRLTRASRRIMLFP